MTLGFRLDILTHIKEAHPDANITSRVARIIDLYQYIEGACMESHDRARSVTEIRYVEAPRSSPSTFITINRHVYPETSLKRIDASIFRCAVRTMHAGLPRASACGSRRATSSATTLWSLSTASPFASNWRLYTP